MMVMSIDVWQEIVSFGAPNAMTSLLSRDAPGLAIIMLSGVFMMFLLMVARRAHSGASG
jgi:hypothetical protein